MLAECGCKGSLRQCLPFLPAGGFLLQPLLEASYGMLPPALLLADRTTFILVITACIADFPTSITEIKHDLYVSLGRKITDSLGRSLISPPPPYTVFALCALMSVKSWLGLGCPAHCHHSDHRLSAAFLCSLVSVSSPCCLSSGPTRQV